MPPSRPAAVPRPPLPFPWAAEQACHGCAAPASRRHHHALHDGGAGPAGPLGRGAQVGGPLGVADLRRSARPARTGMHQWLDGVCTCARQWAAPPGMPSWAPGPRSMPSPSLPSGLPGCQQPAAHWRPAPSRLRALTGRPFCPVLFHLCLPRPPLAPPLLQVLGGLLRGAGHPPRRDAAGPGQPGGR